jgi:hypothetical protein
MPKSSSTKPAADVNVIGPFEFRAALWLYQGKGSWHFITVPPELGEEIRTRTAMNRRGWGSVAIEAIIGTSTWRTSIFPQKDTGAYLLPVKEEIRTRESLEPGREIAVSLSVIL